MLRSQNYLLIVFNQNPIGGRILKINFAKDKTKRQHRFLGAGRLLGQKINKCVAGNFFLSIDCTKVMRDIILPNSNDSSLLLIPTIFLCFYNFHHFDFIFSVKKYVAHESTSTYSQNGKSVFDVRCIHLNSNMFWTSFFRWY